MITIWKSVLLDSYDVIAMPENAQVLCVQMQRGQVCMWYMCDPSQPKVKRLFRVVGTGHEMSSGNMNEMSYVGTVQHNDLVWHVFEDVSSRPAS